MISTPLWAHQVEARSLIARQRGTLLGHDMGTGKSLTALTAICDLPPGSMTLIITPKAVITHWPREFQKHLLDPARFHVVPLTKGTAREKAATAESALALTAATNRDLVLVLNYEILLQPALGAWVAKRFWDLVIADECHRIKAPGGKISRYMGRLRKMTLKRIGLSGTPLPHSPLDIYAQYRFIDPNIFGLSYTAFKARYAIFNPLFPSKVERLINQDDLKTKMHSIAHVVRKRDVLDLPPVQHIEMPVELSFKTMQTYRQVEDEFCAFVESGAITAANALVKLLRLQQITSGTVKLEDGTEADIGGEKQEVLESIIEDLPEDEPVVVFARFTSDLRRVHNAAAKLSRHSLELSGHRNELDCWQNGSAPILAVQIQAGGVGIDLTRAAYCVFLSVGFSLGDYEQALARLDRPGQTRNVTYYHIPAAGTVDQKIYRALKERRDVVEAIINGYQFREGQRVHQSNTPAACAGRSGRGFEEATSGHRE